MFRGMYVKADSPGHPLSLYRHALKSTYVRGIPVPACLLSATLHATASILVSVHITQAVDGIASLTHRDISNFDACTGFEARVLNVTGTSSERLLSHARTGPTFTPSIYCDLAETCIRR